MVKAHAISGRFYLGLNHSHDDEVGTSGIRQEGGAVVLMNCPGFLSKGEKKEVQNLVSDWSINCKHPCLAGGGGFFSGSNKDGCKLFLSVIFTCVCCFCQKAMIPNKNCDLQARGI